MKLVTLPQYVQFSNISNNFPRFDKQIEKINKSHIL